jgi:hypothetical protein
MPFLAGGTLFLFAALCFVGTYQYLVPKFTAGAVSFATGDLWQKMLLGFVLTASTVVLGYYLVQNMYMLFLMVAIAGGPFALFGILGAGLIVFLLSSLFYGLQTWILGRIMAGTIRCTNLGGALRAGLAPGLVTTIIAISAIVFMISHLHID